MDLSNLIGQNVTAIGDCGIYKDKLIYGKLVEHNQNETIIENKYLCSVNPKTVKKYVVQLVVVNENILGYIQPELPDTVNFLRASVLKGYTNSITATNKLITKFDKVRLANKNDFEDFRVSFEGYENDPQYEYEKL